MEDEAVLRIEAENGLNGVAVLCAIGKRAGRFGELSRQRQVNRRSMSKSSRLQDRVCANIWPNDRVFAVALQVVARAGPDDSHTLRLML